MDVITEQRQIIEAQRSIIEEQQRIIFQQSNKLDSDSDAAGSTITSCSVRSLPTVSSSTETELGAMMLDVKVEPDSESRTLSTTMLDRMVAIDTELQRSISGEEQACPPSIDPVDATQQVFTHLHKGGKGNASTPVQLSCSNTSSWNAGRQTHGHPAVAERDCEHKWREDLRKVIDYVNTTLDSVPPVDRGPARVEPPTNQLKTVQEASQAKPEIALQELGDERSEAIHPQAKPEIALQKLGDARSEAIQPQTAGAAPSVTVPRALLGVPDSKAEQPRSLPGLPGSLGILGHNLKDEMFMFDVESWVLCTNISQHGKWLCAASDDKTARVFDLETCHSNSLYRCFAHGDRVWTADFSQDNRTLCTSSSDGCARVFAVQAGHEINCFRHKGVVRSACFSPVGELLCTASHDRTARIFNLTEGSDASEVNRFEHPGWVLSAGWSPTGESLCTAADDMTARIFDVNTGSQVQNIFQSDWISSIKFHPDMKRLCTGSDAMVVRIYDVNSRRILQNFQYSAPVCSASFSPDGNWLCTACSDTHAYIHEMSTGKELLRFKHGSRVCSVNFSPDGRRLCTGSEDGCARVFGYAMQSMLTLVAMAAN